jgi:DNA processing protein
MRICEQGLVVSEYAPGVEPAPWRFPARNRIIAGLAQATVVVEARERSGALITADLALEEGREVFAVPGEITSSLSTGSNRLLRHGAIAADRGLGRARVVRNRAEPPRPPVELGEAAARVLAQIELEPSGADALARALGLDAGELAGILTELELLGVVSERDGFFRVARPLG